MSKTIPKTIPETVMRPLTEEEIRSMIRPMDYAEAAGAIMTAIDPTDSLKAKIEELDARASALEEKAIANEVALKEVMISAIKNALATVNTVAGEAYGDIENASTGLESMNAEEIAKAAVVRGAQVGAAAVIAIVAGAGRDLKEYRNRIILSDKLEECVEAFNLKGKIGNKDYLEIDLPF